VEPYHDFSDAFNQCAGRNIVLRWYGVDSSPWHVNNGRIDNDIVQCDAVVAEIVSAGGRVAHISLTLGNVGFSGFLAKGEERIAQFYPLCTPLSHSPVTYVLRKSHS